ncbi:MAG: type II secretion system F family protein [Deltaproteobacteria bacterium]|nr:type II secretion system F family protein [Deltaproteobacteria bacterium]
MANETILYIGIFGLVLCITNLLRPYFLQFFLWFRRSLYQSKGFATFENTIQQTMYAQGATFEKVDTFQKLSLRIFWIIVGLVLLITVYTQNWALLTLLILYPYMIFYMIRLQLQKRNQAISKHFPYFLDIFILCLEAGMDSMRAIREIAATQTQTPLYQELTWTIQLTQIGQPLSDAMLQTAKRTDHPDILMLAQSMAQSAELGSSLASILRLQAQTLRENIFKNAQAQAQKTPVKMLFPLIFCIFPVVFIILFVPIAISFFSMMR